MPKTTPRTISDRRQGDAPLSSRLMVRPPARAFYTSTLETLVATRIPFVVGGAFAMHHYAKIHRDTKDLDLFLRKADVPDALAALEARGYRTETTFPHWLAKAYGGPHFVDLIFGSANGLCPVDDAWFERAATTKLFGIEVPLCPIEEVIWTKAFVMERERFDGADICHLIEAAGDTVDWARLIDRFGATWPVLLGHLVFYEFVYPNAHDRIPAWVWTELFARRAAASDGQTAPVCRGTLLSREQYLVDLHRGMGDARVPPWGDIPQRHVDIWTDAIAHPPATVKRTSADPRRTR